ncbi:Aste57867_12437 [Aphanomyces stellatus]|uniref:Splicing factor Cactin n=1 Tax=Aphanomyces stellatus TaxID=120398 RepID=A0A485KWC4_9STRA|nr:hypothetical protein As57867_012391 [Aphanomyces stellatus]VFT89288.1 Aste57867_12437 [Aphanomyces stellatus]
MGKSEKKKHKYDSDDSVERERRERKKSKKASKIVKEMGYSNDQNPFGDANLTEKFVWHKNQARDKAPSGSSSRSSRGHERESSSSSRRDEQRPRDDKREELVREILKVRKRRDERDAEREEMERLKNEEMRLRDSAQFEDWQQKEEDFHLSQARVRSHIRIREGREKPIDLLAKNLMLASMSAVAMIDPTKEMADTLAELKHAQVELRPPEELLAGLDPHELAHLQDEIRVYMELEGDGGEHFKFWKLLRVLCTHALARQARHGGGRGAIHRDVEDAIHDLLAGKSTSELLALKQEIDATLASGSGGIDVEYYENVLAEIKVYLAKTQLRKLHDTLLARLADRIEAQEAQAAYRQRAAESAAATAGSTSATAASPAAPLVDDDVDDSKEAIAMHEMEMERGLGEKEEEFLDLVPTTTTTAPPPAWALKYRPRKPRFFNRVKTGYDWNKYNQTHYDEDNPPPKIVQGYKFNIFYPELLEKHIAPTYTFEKTDASDFCVLRFHAGPPYLDIAFKIVNQEWEFSSKRGFKCVFERGVLHLHFSFKRHRYRR